MIVGWLLGHAYTIAYAHESARIPVIFHQINLILVPSTPYMLLGMVLYLITLNRNGGV